MKLGLLFPDSGSAASLFGPFRAGVDARLGVANAAGGVLGRKVTYAWRDDGSQPETNRVAATALVNTDKVFGIVESTSVATGSADLLHDQGIPVTGASLESVWTVNDNMFSYSNLVSAHASVSTWGDFVAAKGGHTAAVVVSQFSDTSRAFAAELTESLTAAGIQVVTTVDATAPIDYPTLGAKIRNSGADVLVGAVTGTAFGQAVLAAKGANANLRVVLSPTGYDQRMLDLFKTIISGVYFVVDFLPFELARPAHRTFLDAMANYAPEIQPANQQAALSGWISADMMLRGLTAAGPCPTRRGLIAALRAVHDYDAGGLLPGPIDFTKDFGQLTKCLTFVRVTPDGRRFEVTDPVSRCGSALDH